MWSLVVGAIVSAIVAATPHDVIITGTGHGTFHAFTSVPQSSLPLTPALSITQNSLNTSTTEWVLAHPKLPVVYVVDNRGSSIHGRIFAYRIHSLAQGLWLEQISEVSSAGAGPCFLSVDDEDQPQWLLVANYLSGTGSSIRILPGGQLSEPVSVTDAPTGHAQFPGVGQEQSYAHCIRRDPYTHQYVMLADAGLNVMRHYLFDNATGLLSPNGHTNMTIWRPRHFEFHSTVPVVYVLHELSSMVSVWEFDVASGRLKSQVLQVLPTLTPSFTNFPYENLPAEMVIHGANMFVSNRGGDSIATYQIHPTTAELSILGFPAAAGQSPRHLLVASDGSNATMWVANENTASIAAFSLEGGTLDLRSNTSGIPKVECLAFFSASKIQLHAARTSLV